MRLPKPRLARSPANSSWVNEYTWVWLESAWKEKEATARAGASWATVTAKPKKMRVTAGSQSVSCPGPGRAWTPADGAGAPSKGGCALMFSESGKGIDVTVTVPYEVSWTGSDGSGGDLGVLTTTATQSVTVLEAAAVARS